MTEAAPIDTRSIDWRGVRRVLCVRLDAMGDVLMTTPALHAAKRSSPERHVTLLTSPGGAAAASLVPDVDEVLVYDAPWVKATAPRESSAPDHELIRALRAKRFDAAVVFTVYSQNPLPAAMMCYLADIPLRLAHCRENPYQLLTDWVHDPEPETMVRHEVRRQLDLVERVGWRTRDERLRMAIPPSVSARVDERLRSLGLCPDQPNRLDDGQPWAVLHPGASAPSRRYSCERYAAVVRTLTEQHGWHIVLTGTDSEAALLDRLERSVGGRGTVSRAGALTLPELGALLARAPLLISNNTGPVHVAAAVGTPVVDLYALTNPQHTPWQVPSRVLYHEVPCRICYKSVCPEGHHACLEGVPPARVVDAALELMRDACNAREAGESHRATSAAISISTASAVVTPTPTPQTSAAAPAWSR